MTEKELHKHMLKSDRLYCCYCLQPQTNYHCCQENHFITYADMYPEDQAFLIEEGEV